MACDSAKGVASVESCIVEHMFDVAELAAVDPRADEAALIEQIAWLERVKSAASAGQARAAVALDAKRRAAEAAAGVPTATQGRGVAGEVAVARRDAPARGGRHLGLAKALVHQMPHTLAALESGALSEWRATLIARESACLDVEDRRLLDAELCANIGKLEGMGDARIGAAAKEIAARLHAQAVVDRAAKAEADRTVTIRPAPDCMTYVTVLLPVAQGVGVYAVLRRSADTTVDDRSRGQVMADTLVERVTGRPADASAPVALNLVMSDQALWGQDNAPAVLDGHGPIPASVAQRLVRGGWPITGRWRRCGGCIGTPRAGRWWRWSRDRGCSRRVWPDSSACETAPVAPRTVMRRFGITITPHRATVAGRPVPPMSWVSANGATTPKRRRAGASPRETKTVRTQRTSSRPPVPGIGRQRHRYQGHH